jgi:acetyltransferase
MSETLAIGASSEIRIRPVRPDDSVELRRFYEGLSPDSRLRRFLGVVRGLSDTQARLFCAPDHRHDEGFVAVAGERIVGHLCLEPDGRETAEVAIAVADAWQGHGIGHRLMDAGLRWARAAGVTTLTATMFADNAAIQRLLLGLGLRAGSRYVSAGVTEIRIELPAAGGERAAA